ncbi:MAG TPA: hypothetical protein PL048_11115, partial [Leptospiraceae bacterium]|nr:hypothetical protein [Leptospiraceae bacterium]
KNEVKTGKREMKQLRATFTGKRIEDGGSEGREEATGLGGVYVLESILKKLFLHEELYTLKIIQRTESPMQECIQYSILPEISFFCTESLMTLLN